MTKLCFQYLAIFSNEIVRNSIQIVPKWVENFAQKQINLKYIANVVEFRQICSHWSQKKRLHKFELNEMAFQLLL